MTPPRIEDYRFGSMVVDGEQHASDLILLPDRVVSDWWRAQGHRLVPNDLTSVFEAAPEVLVVGTGADERMEVPAETRQALQTAGIDLRVSATGEAWQVYNALREQRRVAGAFHLTC